MPSRQRAALRSFWIKIACDCGQNFGRFCHPAQALFAAGHIARIRSNNRYPVALQGCNITLGGGVMPHAHIHRGGKQHRGVGGQQQCCCQIIGMAPGHFGHQICSGWGHHQQISLA